MNYDFDKAAMEVALKEAKRTLPMFLEAFEKKNAGRFYVKVLMACPDPDGGEYIWIDDLNRVGDDFTGRYANVPGCREDVRRGSPLRFKRDDIVDWSFMRDGKMHGSYSTRVTLKDMSPSEADEYRRILAPLPD
ncbi:YegJ family protein [Variibacter gotjawalensis]|uniref:YegJ family protein n=1 Tax=Variibacter gotjawalensis TaxID=1333996 RepID=UPI0012FE6637|nr:DUF2314 domain-containing protein [Variibacter gotjawalensis]NIK50098.1 uncharacterized protein YegJ (DUF2314 family) [Variibacter gotjawalensis]